MRYLLFLFFHPSLPLYRFFFTSVLLIWQFHHPFSSSPPFPFYRLNKITNYACRKEGERRVGKTVANISQCPNQQNVYSQGEMYRNSLFAKYGAYERLFYQGEKCFYLSGAVAVYVGRGRENMKIFFHSTMKRERQKKVLLVAFGRDCMACLGTKKRFSSLEVMFGKAVGGGGRQKIVLFFLPSPHNTTGSSSKGRQGRWLPPLVFLAPPELRECEIRQFWLCPPLEFRLYGV